jgi:hypothetical protein
VRRTLRVFGLCAVIGAVLGPILVVVLAGTDTGHVPLWIALFQVAIMGALGGVFVAAFATAFEKLVALITRR